MNKYIKIGLLGCGHLMVDLQGLYLINYMNNKLTFTYIAAFFILYNLIAFGFQIIFGYIADIKNLYFSFIIIGLIISMIALQLPTLGILMVIISALGNALYHIGGGVISMNLFPKKAAPAGIFVAPGAFGVFIGIKLALSEVNYQIYILLVTTIIIIALYITFKNDLPQVKETKVNKNMTYIISLIIGIVFIRGFIGTMLVFPWKDNLYLGISLVIGVFIGKFLGGILGDYFSYKKIGIIGLFCSLPLLILGYNYAVFGIIGALLFNLTMAITLFIIIDSLGKYKGFAFGLTTLALFLSYLPYAFGLHIDFGIYYTVVMSILVIIAIFTLNKTVDLYKEGEY